MVNNMLKKILFLLCFVLILSDCTSEKYGTCYNCEKDYPISQLDTVIGYNGPICVNCYSEDSLLCPVCNKRFEYFSFVDPYVHSCEVFCVECGEEIYNIEHSLRDYCDNCASQLAY